MNGGFVYRHRVKSEHAGATIAAYHARRFHARDEIGWRETIAAGRVRVNGRVAVADELVATGDVLEFHRPPWEEPDAPTSFGVVFEDDDVLVVDKPSGLQVLPAGPFLERTVWTLVRASHPSRADAAPVHRLGRGTSGLLLLGKTERARASLSLQFREQSPTKTYLALVEGTSLATSFRAEQRIGDVQHGPLRIHVARPDGKPALTRVRVLERDTRLDRSLVAAQPITGRPDQIRIHLAAHGAPIVGDPLFGVGGVAKCDTTPGAGGYLLHATALSFTHPVDGTRVKLRLPPRWLDEKSPP